VAYDLHIERPATTPDSEPEAISLEEWKAAVSATPGVRLVEAPAHTAINPQTGEVISIGARDGDAEVFFADDREWRFVFRWGRRSARFAARFELGDTLDPIWVAAVALASRLGAVIRGDEGEVYDLKTGTVVDT
jgi:hypothetical protein